MSVAETVTPSVGGRKRVEVTAAAVLSAASSGALVGFVGGVAWALTGWPPMSRYVAAVIVVAAALVDVLALRWPRLAAPGIGSQVPREWWHLFSPVTAAALYAARLGVAPLTLRPAWLWWAGIALAVSVDPFVAGAIAASFGAARMVIVIITSLIVEGSMPARMARVRAVGAPAGVAVSVAAIVASAFMPPGIDRPAAAEAAAERAARIGRDAADPTRGLGGVATDAPSAAASATATASSRLVDAGPAGYERIPDDRPGLGVLDLAEAAAIEQDSSAERSLLVTRRFRMGEARAWRDTEADAVAYVMRYRFSSAANAQAYLIDGFITLEGRGARLYTVEIDFVDGARGFSQAERRDAGSAVSHGVAWTDGPDFFLVFVSGNDSALTPADARTLASRQAQALTLE